MRNVREKGLYLGERVLIRDFKFGRRKLGLFNLECE